jgi:hypothetical protein
MFVLPDKRAVVSLSQDPLLQWRELLLLNEALFFHGVNATERLGRSFARVGGACGFNEQAIVRRRAAHMAFTLCW